MESIIFIQSWLISKGVQLTQKEVMDILQNRRVSNLSNHRTDLLLAIAEEIFSDIQAGRIKVKNPTESQHSRSVNDEILKEIKVQADKLQTKIPVSSLNELALEILRSKSDWDSETVRKSLIGFLDAQNEVVTRQVKTQLEEIDSLADQAYLAVDEEVRKLASRIFQEV
jgi:hypothetical protein